MDFFKKCTFICAAIIVASVPSAALSHGTGASLERETGDYMVDIGYSPEEISAQSSVLFDFSLLELETGESVSFSDVWVRVKQGNKTVFAGGLHNPEIGKPVMTHTFPTEGDYTLYVRYEDGNDPLAETEFSINASSPRGKIDSGGVFSVPALLIGLLGGAGVGLLFPLFKKKNK